MNARSTESRRRAATEQHQLAIAAITTLFDRVDDLRETLARLTGLASLGADDDPLREAEAVLQVAEQIDRALAAVRAAALAAAEHRGRGDLVSDIGTRLVLLFPRTAAASPKLRERAASDPAPLPADGPVGDAVDSAS